MHTHSPASTDKEAFLKELRSVTGPSHRQLEELPLSQAIVSPRLTPEQYALYLVKMNAFVSAFEQTLFPALLPVFPDIDTRRKAGLLQKDLQFLETKGIETPAFPTLQLHAGESPAYDAGRMYVLEGSTLGGKFIYKNINATLGYSAEEGAAYFAGYGPATGSMWTGFLDELCTFAAKPGNTSAIYKGADDAFRMMYDLLK